MSYTEFWHEKLKAHNQDMGADLAKLYQDYLGEITKFNPDLSLYYEINFFTSRLQSENSDKKYFPENACIKSLKFRLELYSIDSRLHAYQIFFKHFSKLFRDDIPKETEFNVGYLLLTKNISRNKNLHIETIDWLNEKLKSNINERLISYKSKLTDHQTLSKDSRELGSELELVFSLIMDMLKLAKENTEEKEYYCKEIKSLEKAAIDKLKEISIILTSKNDDAPRTKQLCEFSFCNLLQLAVTIDLEKKYESEMLEIFISTYFFLHSYAAGSPYFYTLCKLLEKQSYLFISKLHAAKTPLNYLAKEIELTTGLFNPSSTVLDKINGSENIQAVNQVKTELKKHMLNQNPLKAIDILQRFSRENSCGPAFFRVLAKQVFFECLEEAKGKDKLCLYLQKWKSFPEPKLNISFYSSNKNIFHEELEKVIRRKKNIQTTPLPENYNHTDAKTLPLGLYVAIIKTEKTIPQSFYQFLEHYNDVNAKNKKTYQIDIDCFLLFHIGKIINLYELMGDEAFLFMKEMVKTSVIALSNYLDNLSIIPREYFPILRAWVARFADKKPKETLRTHEQLLTSISYLELLRRRLDKKTELSIFKTNYVATLLTITSSNKQTFSDLFKYLNQKLAAVYKALLGLPENKNINFLLLEEQSSLFLRLIIGRHRLPNNHLKLIFDKCIEYDLREDVDFTYFSESLEQENELGRNLAKHNQAIRSQLKMANINTERAFNYARQFHFSCATNDGVDWEGLARAIYADLLNLSKLFENKTNDVLKHPIQKNIQTILNQVSKGKTINLKSIFNGSQNKLLDRINLKLSRLLSKENIPSEILEHGKHFSDHYSNLKKENFKAGNVNAKQAITKDFCVAVWDKNNLNTFLLGDFLSCCLAPDGGQFQAMVQRRMDSAMMMHVIYDKTINEPVCGNWLFFAKDKNNPGDIYVVANFFEIRAGYALKKNLRDRLVQELLDFTGKYAEDIGAKDFIIRPLTYGLVPDFKGKFNLETLEIEKIGGFLEGASYYLHSLELSEFYLYDKTPTLLQHTEKDSVYDAPQKPDQGFNVKRMCN